MLLSVETKTYYIWLLSNDILFIPSFLKIGQLLLNMKAMDIEADAAREKFLQNYAYIETLSQIELQKYSSTKKPPPNSRLQKEYLKRDFILRIHKYYMASQKKL
jgi:hypothetical protein